MVERVALVTGAGRGIGQACAARLAAQGATVLLVGRDAARLEAAAAHIDERQGRRCAVVLPSDVTDPAATRELFQRVFREYRRLDTLVANAGVMDAALIGMVTPDLVQRVFATNTYALLYGAQYASRLMARGGGGSIVALSSIVGVQGHAGQSVYAGSKAAVIGIVRALAQELAPQQIRVNAVAPGFIDTELTRVLPEARREQTLARIPMGRAGTSDDVAGVVAFLADDASRYVSGQVIGVDGALRL